MSKSYRDLKVLQASFKLSVDVYEFCQQMHKSEQFGIASQIQQAAVSIPSNITEGQQRNGKNEFKQFLEIARGSAAELSTQLLIAERVYGFDGSELISELEEVQKMLYALQSKL